MKKKFLLFTYLIIFFLSTLTTSCQKESYEIRFKNEYSYGVWVEMTGIFYPSIGPGITTEYNPIIKGTNKIVLSDLSGINLQKDGNITIDGKGENKWTVTITSGFEIVIHKD